MGKRTVTFSVDQALATFTASPDDAKALIAVGVAPADTAIPAPELAAWTLTAQSDPQP